MKLVTWANSCPNKNRNFSWTPITFNNCHKVLQLLFSIIKVKFKLVLTPWCDISNTKYRVWPHFKQRDDSWKYEAQRNIFDELRGVWKCVQTLFWVLDISSQLKLKLRRKQRKKIVKIYAVTVIIYFVWIWWTIGFEKDTSINNLIRDSLQITSFARLSQTSCIFVLSSRGHLWC